MPMTFPYCNIDDDLQSVYKDIEKFQGLDELSTFVLTSGQTNTFEKINTGHIGIIYDDGLALAEQNSIANVESNAGSWWWDPDVNKLYVHQTGAGDPDTSVILAQGVGIWKDFKQKIADRSFQQLDSMLDRKYPTPLPFARRSYEGVNYDADILVSAAYLICSNIIRYRDPDDPLWQTFKNMVWNTTPGEEGGIIWEHMNGIRTFSFESTQDQFDGNLQRKVKTSGSSGYIRLAGRGNRANKRKVAIIITTEGAPGTAIYKYSADEKTNFTENLNVLAGGQYQHIIDDIYLAFEGTFKVLDEWELTVIGDEVITNPTVRGAILRLN